VGRRLRRLDPADLSVIEERGPPGAGETLHVHHRARQVFYVLRGQLTIEVGLQPHVLESSDSIHVPPGAPHRVHNTGSGEACFLVISTPTTHGDRTNLE